MTRPLVSYDPDAKSSEVAATLRRDGAVIARGVLEPEAVDVLMGVLDPKLAAKEPEAGEFYGERTKTLGNLFAQGKELSEHCLVNPRLLEIVDGTLLPQRPMGLPDEGDPHGSDALGGLENPGSFDLAAGMGQARRDPVFGPNCHHYRVQSSAVFQIWPGGKLQQLHREMDIYRPFIEQEPDQPDYVVTLLVAGTDFTLENGATRVVVGSHQWPADRFPDESEVSQAVMPKGSVLFWLGRTFHGLGANRSDAPRTGIGFGFVANWLCQEENPFLSVPPELARTLPEKAQQLLGYRASMVGWAHGLDSENQLRPGAGGPV